MHRRAMQPHPRLERAAMGMQARKGRQERRMDVDDATLEPGDESLAEHPHEAGQHDPVDLERLEALEVDWIVLAGFMRVLGEAFVARFEGRIVNIHPSLLPSFPGLHTHRRALEAGVRLHGATVHLVTSSLDLGPIVAQAAVPVLDGDDPDGLAERVLAVEHRLYPMALRWLVEGRIIVEGQRCRLRDPREGEMQWFVASPPA